MINVEEIKKFAKGLLPVAIKNEKLNYYIMGIDPFSIKSPDQYGGLSECTFAKMEAIYDYYRENPDSKIDQELFATLEFCTKNVKGSYAFLSVLRILEYQIVSENEGRAPFKMDAKSLFANVKINLKENKKLYQSEIYEEAHFWDEIKQYNDSLNSSHGLSIL